jgi:hypothetical protein
LKATVFHPGQNKAVKVNSGLVRYGGDTQRLNFGIGYRGQSYANSRYIDVACQGDLTVLLTLQPAGKKHPAVKRLPGEKSFVVGNQVVQLP